MRADSAVPVGERSTLPGRIATAAALVVVLAVSVAGCSGGEIAPARTTGTPSETSRIQVVADGPQVAATTPEPVDPQWFVDAVEKSSGPQMTYLRLDNGWMAGTTGQRRPRPALSLAKLYIADWVYAHGNRSQKARATEMIETSDDTIADELYADFPESIDGTAAVYGLESTRGEEKWGYSLTSTYDVVRFVAIKLQTDPDSKVIDAMRHPAPFAADGYPQDYGTGTIGGVLGTKWGWSNNRQYHASVSFGRDFVVAASRPGDAGQLTALVVTQMNKLRSIEPVRERQAPVLGPYLSPSAGREPRPPAPVPG